MRWEEVREQFPNEWVVCEALKSRSEDGYWLIDEVAIIDCFEDFFRSVRDEMHRGAAIHPSIMEWLSGLEAGKAPGARLLRKMMDDAESSKKDLV